jgi:hypothetical protein
MSLIPVMWKIGEMNPDNGEQVRVHVLERR